MPRVLAVGLGALFGPRCARVSAGSAKCTSAPTAQLLDHEPPARRGLQRRLDLATVPTSQPAPHTLAIGRTVPPPAQLTGGDTQGVEGGSALDADQVPLRSSLRGLLTLDHTVPARSSAPELRRSVLMPSFPDGVKAPLAASGGRWRFNGGNGPAATTRRVPGGDMRG